MEPVHQLMNGLVVAAQAASNQDSVIVGVHGSCPNRRLEGTYLGKKKRVSI
jgi:hypothetical protein